MRLIIFLYLFSNIFAVQVPNEYIPYDNRPVFISYKNGIRHDEYINKNLQPDF